MVLPRKCAVLTACEHAMVCRVLGCDSIYSVHTYIFERQLLKKADMVQLLQLMALENLQEACATSLACSINIKIISRVHAL